MPQRGVLPEPAGGVLPLHVFRRRQGLRMDDNGPGRRPSLLLSRGSGLHLFAGEALPGQTAGHREGGGEFKGPFHRSGPERRGSEDASRRGAAREAHARLSQPPHPPGSVAGRDGCAFVPETSSASTCVQGRNPMKILFVRPRPSEETIGLQHVMVVEPLELEVLAALVDPTDTPVIVDMILERKPFVHFLRREKPDAVCVTGYITHVHIMKEYCRIAKGWSPEVATIVGGVHCE